jgi:hypothetical protein
MPNAPAPVRPTRSAIARAALLAAAWVPALTALVWFLPKFRPIFSRLDEKGELPVLTHYIMAASELIRSPWGLPAIVALAILILTDICVERGLRRSTVGHSLYRFWFGLMIACAPILFVLSLVAILLPGFKMSASA